MTSFEFGTVVLVPFPFTNQLESKQRPAIVINSNDYYHHKNDIILIAVTSQIKHDLLFAELPIKQWHEAGSLKPSLIKPIIFTLDKYRVRKVLGSLATADLKNLKELLQLMIAY